MIDSSSFAPRLVAWQRMHGRHDLPWQKAGATGKPPAYHVWLSEVMLQQTQVSTVIDYYHRFLTRFPDVQALAAAPLDDVLAFWSGLGYYSRARNLHKAAQKVVDEFKGEFPADTQQLVTLHGVGRSTAAAIAALAHGKRAAIMDGNVKRVLSRVYAVNEQNMLANEKKLWEYAESLAPSHDIESYTQGLMDLGATVCTRSKPNCNACPFERDCLAHQRGEEQLFPKRKVKAADDSNEKTEDAKASVAVPTAARGRTKAVERRKKSAVFLLAYQGEQLWLERRAEQGIWGGLWCAPEHDNMESALAQALSLGQVVSHHVGIEHKHSFTHFDLFATPLHVELSELKHKAAEQMHTKWVSKDEALRIGIPALLRKWLMA